MPLDSTNWSTDTQVEATALLIRARGFIERGWCTHHLAQSKRGDHVNPTSALAVAWCAFGALIAAGGPYLPQAESHPAFRRLKAAIPDPAVHHWNDRQETVEPVLAAFDSAIASG